MDIEMSTDQELVLVEFIERKLRERMGKDHTYTVRQMAEQIGMDENTLYRWLREKSVKRLDLSNLRLLVRHFGRELTDELGITPE